MGDCGHVKWNTKENNVNASSSASSSQNAASVVNPKYSIIGERLRHVTPTALQCSMFCGGRHCKYCNPPIKFKKEDMVIDGLYSAWITDNILATSRPSTEAIKKFDIINQFHNNGIASIINLQHAGEHASCGFGLEPGGFSYVPEDFMKNNIFFYNFEWNDYGVRSLQSILDMVQVMDFALLNGKAAIHCHAGLGRTGVLIACYIIFSERSTASEAIYKVRKSRPRSIQTREQIHCVKDFAAYIKPMWIIFAEEHDCRVTIEQFLNRQRRMLHGEEAQTLRYVPKIVFIILQRLLALAHVEYDMTSCVKTTYYNFTKKPQHPHESDATKSNVANTSINLSINEAARLTKHLTDDNLFCLKNQDTDIASPIRPSTCPDFKVKENKSSSMPNVAFLSSEGGMLLNNHMEARKMENIIKEGFEENMEKFNDNNRDDVSLMSSFNSWGGQSLSLSYSLDASLLFRQGSIVSDTSLLSRSLNTGLSPSEEVVKYLAFQTPDVNVHNQVARFKHKLNTEHNAWDELRSESSISVLCALLWSFIKHLKGPIVTAQIIDIIKLHSGDPQTAGDEVKQKDKWKLIEGFVTCLSKLSGRTEDVNRALRRFAVALTGDESIPRIKLYKPAVMDKEINGNETQGTIFFKFLLSYLHMLKARKEEEK